MGFVSCCTSYYPRSAVAAPPARDERCGCWPSGSLLSTLVHFRCPLQLLGCTMHEVARVCLGWRSVADWPRLGPLLACQNLLTTAARSAQVGQDNAPRKCWPFKTKGCNAAAVRARASCTCTPQLQAPRARAASSGALKEPLDLDLPLLHQVELLAALRGAAAAGAGEKSWARRRSNKPQRLDGSATRSSSRAACTRRSFHRAGTWHRQAPAPPPLR